MAEADRSLEAFPYGENIGTLDSVIRLPTKDQQEGIRAAHGDQRRLSAINTDAMSPTAGRSHMSFMPLGNSCKLFLAFGASAYWVNLAAK